MALNVLRGHCLDPISVVDFGCGKARILMIAAECGFARAAGVEFSPELCLIARANCRKFEQNFPTTTTLTVVESDAVDYAIKDDDNLFFFFNPFDATVMTAVLRNIAASLKHHPRFVILAIYNTDAGPLVAQFPEFSHLSDLDYWGYRVCLFTGI